MIAQIDKHEVDKQKIPNRVNCKYEQIYCLKKFQEVDMKVVISFSQDNKFLFVASFNKQNLLCLWDQYYQFKFLEFSNNQITNCEKFTSEFVKGPIIACLFLRNTNKAILGWESGSIELWKQKQNHWNHKKILYEPERHLMVKQIILNKKQDLLIASSDRGGTHFWIRQDDKYCKWHENEDQTKKIFFHSLNFNETEKFLIGQKQNEDFILSELPTIIILQKITKLRWVIKRQISFCANFARNNQTYFFMENIINFQNYLIQWNKWSGKLIKKKKFLKNNFCSILANIQAKILFHLDTSQLNIYQIQNNDLNLQQVILVNEQILHINRSYNLDNCKYLITCLGQELSIYENQAMISNQMFE